MVQIPATGIYKGLSTVHLHSMKSVLKAGLMGADESCKLPELLKSMLRTRLLPKRYAICIIFLTMTFCADEDFSKMRLTAPFGDDIGRFGNILVSTVAALPRSVFRDITENDMDFSAISLLQIG